MPILTKAPEPSILTHDQKKALTKALVQSSVNRCFASMLDAYKKNAAQVWENPQGLTPQDVLDGFGTDAAELFRLASLLKGVINAAVPGTIPDSAAPIVINADGTVTVNTEPPSQPSTPPATPSAQ